MWQYNYDTELYHHGILGQKWGVRKKRTYYDRVGARYKKKGTRYMRKQGKNLSRLNKTKFKSSLNPLYLYRLGKVSNNAKKIKQTNDYIKTLNKLETLEKKYNDLNIDYESYINLGLEHLYKQGIK